MPAVEGFLACLHSLFSFCLFFFLFLSLYLSLSLSLSLALVFALALARFVPMTEGAWACVPPIFLAHGAIAPAFSKRNRLVGTLEFPWLVLCVVFRLFPEVCALDTSECWNFQDICASGA